MSKSPSQPDFKLPREGDMPLESRSVLRWLWFFARPYRRTIALFSTIRLIRFAFLATLPLAIGRIINGFETGWGFENPDKMMLYVALYMAVYTCFLLIVFLFYRESVMEDRMVRGMTLFSVRYMNALPLVWHEAQGSGGKLQRIMTARESLKRLYRLYKWQAVPFIGTYTGIMVSVLLIDAPAWFFLLYIGFAVTFFTVAWRMGRTLTPLHNRHNILLEKLLAGVYEFVSAIRTVKAFHMNDFIASRARYLEHEGHGAMKDVIQAIFLKWTALNGTGVLWMLVFVSVCLGGVLNGWLSVGAFATCFFLAYNLWSTLEQMVFIQDEFLEARNGFLRLSETLSARPQVLDLKPVETLPVQWQTIEFKNVTFSYNNGDAEALQDISLTIRRGDKVALVGKSGAGKSTLIKLLMKQVWPDSGTISVDGHDMRHLDSGAWLGHIGYVPQDVELFNMSIRDNILLDKVEQVDEVAYRRAVEQAALADFVASLPDKDETFIGERGVKLSGGQRQRLGIARALVRQAELIIFDEATSALDSLSEQAIQQAIEDSFAGKTLVAIAHRLSTVRHVDRIFVLEEGRLIEQGSFEELLEKKGTFARLWALQSGHYGESNAAE